MNAKHLAVAAVLALVSGNAAAQSAATPAPVRGEMCTSISQLAVSTPQGPIGIPANVAFNCESLGRVTIPAIYEAGWRVVAKNVEEVSHRSEPAVRYRWVIVIETRS